MQFSNFSRIVSGSTILIKNEIPIENVQKIKYFTDNSSGSFLKKEVRWSFSGTYWSAWETLTQRALSSIDTHNSPYTFLEIRYVVGAGTPAGNVTSFVLNYDAFTSVVVPQEVEIPDVSTRLIHDVIQKYVVTQITDASTLNGYPGSWYLNRAHHTGQQAISTVIGLQAILNSLNNDLNTTPVNIPGSGYGTFGYEDGSTWYFNRVDAGPGLKIANLAGVITLSVDQSSLISSTGMEKPWNIALWYDSSVITGNDNFRYDPSNGHILIGQPSANNYLLEVNGAVNVQGSTNMFMHDGVPLYDGQQIDQMVIDISNAISGKQDAFTDGTYLKEASIGDGLFWNDITHLLDVSVAGSAFSVVEISTNYTAAGNQLIFANVHDASLTITFPNYLNNGDIIEIVDYSKTSASTGIYIDPSSHLIDNSSDNFCIDINGGSLRLSYSSLYDNFVILNIETLEHLYTKPTIVPPPPPLTGALELTYNSIGNVPVDYADSLASWNTWFNLPTYGTPFTSVEVVGNTVKLYGGENITFRDGLFSAYAYSSIYIEKIDDKANCVVALTGWGPFATNQYLKYVSLPALTYLNSGAFYSNSNNLSEIYLPAVTACADGIYNWCQGVTVIYMPQCVNLGATLGNDGVFGSLTTANKIGKLYLTLPSSVTADDDYQWLIYNLSASLLDITLV